ncbi:endoribonuclease Dicer homolog 2-like [Lactuca sativa]|uniref:endoribonuclease Dicer homolog 2-like n=1 Tax=Lactuca sativa TaxID=4236 RepID=UPI0022AEB077|nr:endoribonuclease Dicer homolog 2-like [Lactuca sativa]
MAANDDGSGGETSADQFPFARSYQIEALEQAIKQNTIVFLETGSGKTLIAIMLLRHYAYLLRKPSRFFAVFLVPTVVLVQQQAENVRKHVDLKVEEYWGQKGVDFWKAADWKKQQDENQIMVMTPQILLNALSHSFLSLDDIKLLIFDECHHAKKKHAMALIMKEFYHRRLCDGGSELPRVLGMTASPVEAKVSNSGKDYWEQINNLETVMNSKIYTCASESVLSGYIPFSTVKLKFYEDRELPYHVLEALKSNLSILRKKHEDKVSTTTLSTSSMQNAMNRLSKLHSTFVHCLTELGIFLALKAAEAYSCEKTDLFSWGQLDVRGESIARDFCKDATKVFCSYIPKEWSITQVNEATVSIGLLSTKVVCLIESLAEYRHVKDMRCIIFVERVITARVLKSLLCELHPKLFDWTTKYIAGNHSAMQSQSRGLQNKIVEEFHKGMVNIIVATSILEEGLDVQKCNLVIRFDSASTVCSFIQSRGRARMQDSDFLLLVKSGDEKTLNKVNNYLLSGKRMRDESLSHASEPCGPLEKDLYDAVVYHVESTGATLSLSSSISMVYFYCSRLPSDGYFKPYPRFVIDKETGTCDIYFPKSSPLPHVQVVGPTKMLKQLACLEACKKLHSMGALTDNLVPDTLEKEADDEQEAGFEYVEEQVQYIPPELVGFGNNSTNVYYFYTIKLEKHYEYEIPLQDIVLAVSTELEFDNEGLTFDLESDRGNISVSLTYIGTCELTSEQIILTKQFQLIVLRVLIDRNITKLQKPVDFLKIKNDDDVAYDYLLLPSAGPDKARMVVEWKAVQAAMFAYEREVNERMCCLKGNEHQKVHTKNGLVCSCFMEKSLVCTPHNGRVYCTTGRLPGLNGNSPLEITEGGVVSYKSYYKKRHGIDLRHEEETLFAARQLFTVRNALQKSRHKDKETSSSAGVELPSELCFIIMSPVSISTFYSFSFVPSIMHRIESWNIALNLKKMHLCHSMPNGNVPAMKVLEAITTKKCVEKFHLESFETLGDSFLKYAATQQLFKTLQDQHEGILSPKREKIISNDSLCRLGCNCNLPGFIRNEPFEPKTWIVPGDRSSSFKLEEEVLLDERKMYIRGKRVIKKKVVADVVEALIGVFLSEGGELAALSFMRWIGISVDFVNTPYTRALTLHPEKYVNIQYFESLLNYSFRDVSLLVEAITHGSYMLPEIPKCYQRLEFLGDAVLDYMITVHLYNKYPGMSPGMLTDLRSASVNNDCYAQSAVKCDLHKHILHGSHDLHRAIVTTVHEFDQLSLKTTFGWESETSFPKVLGDVIESLAGAILVDSGYDKDRVFQSIRPLLEPLVTPETLKLHPVKELHDICQKNHCEIKKSAKRTETDDGRFSFTIEVVKDDIVLKDSCMAADKKMAERLASKSVLKLLKEYLSAA